MENNLVGLPSDKLGLVLDFVGKLRNQLGFEEEAKLFLNKQYPLLVEVGKPAKTELEKFALKTARMLSKRFSKRIIVDPLPPEFTEERLAFWATFNFHPVFLPGEDIYASRPLKNWTKPDEFFYEMASNTEINEELLVSTSLWRGWYLADFTLGTDCTDESRVFLEDPLSPIITDLREKKLIGKYSDTPLGSRFAITPNEWRDCVLAHVASKLGVTRAQTRLERAIEFNAIGNLYDNNRGKFNSSEWFEDYVVCWEDINRLYGGCRRGGLADFSNKADSCRCDYVAGRPLVSFVL
ncbi:MAG: hypothetical protein G01um101444_337 [Parcubacteria group bacterium Gr01-1014_44]|nr:MAG: hypothetical protein G01um101444_337 [Parcubacteria group bacterium Gr01-1014_44]